MTGERVEMMRLAERSVLRMSHCFRRLAFGMLSKPVIGGQFGSGGFALASQFAVNEGLHQVTYLVVHEDSRLVLGIGREKAGALEVARAVIGCLGRARVLALASKFTTQVARVVAYQTRKRNEQLEPLAPAVRSIPRRRRQIFDASEGLCHYCATPLTIDGKWHIEHKMPKALLGGNEPSNLVASCVSCNTKKRDKTDIEFIAERGAAA